MGLAPASRRREKAVPECDDGCHIGTIKIGSPGMSHAMEQTGTPFRVGWVDTAKGICIILVVMMHTTLGLGEEVGRQGYMHHVVAFALPFRMPDFFLVAGLFLSRTIDRGWRSYGDKRILHFAYFYVLWLLIQSAFKFGAVSGGTAAGFAGHLLTALVEPFGTLWFIYLLAVFSAVTKLLNGVPRPLLLAAAALLEILPIHTGSTVIDEFSARYVYFLAGYMFAPQIFAFAEKVAERPLAAAAGIAAWAVTNGLLALNGTGMALFPTYASLPVVSLVMGGIGALAIVAIASLLTRLRLSAPFAYAGHHSIAIYLAFFIPMAVLRTLAIKLGLVSDVGTAALLITTAAVIAPLVLERLVRHTFLRFLFERPQPLKLKPAGQEPRLAAA